VLVPALVLAAPVPAGAHGGSHRAGDAAPLASGAAPASRAPDADRASTAGVSPVAGTERRVRALETRNLGADHAAEHAEERHTLRTWAAKPAAEKHRIVVRARKAAASMTAAAGPLDRAGRWSTARVDLPTWAINAAMLPTGKVALWGRGALDPVSGVRVNSAPFYLWDPATNRTTEIAPPIERIDYDGDGQEDDLAPAPIFCSGQSFLPSGELFVAGGNLFYPDYGTRDGGAGHDEYGGFSGTYTFDPWTETWTTQPRMAHGRWYPSQVELPDGRQLVASGYDEDGEGADNQQLDVFTPGPQRGSKGTIAEPPAGTRATLGFYPQMQVLPGGRVAYVGQVSEQTRILDPAKLGQAATGSAWTDLRNRVGPVYPKAGARVGGSAALLPGTSRMMFLGGYGEFPTPDGDTFQRAASSVESIDFASDDPRWSERAAGDPPPLNVERSYGNLVSMPDGGFTYVGGAAGYDGAPNGTGNNAAASKASGPFEQRLKAVETWKPGETSWSLGPAQAKFRSYHSTATLLPDGRILSAGDDFWGFDDQPHRGPAATGKPQDQGEIYEPAYLFDGDRLAPRPRITSIPAAVSWGARFGVGVEETGGRVISRATLVAPTATTHAVDMNRGVTDLEVSRVPGKGVNLVAPSGPDVARPGWYMLFAWDASGTPSVARWVQLKAGVDTSASVLQADPPTTPTTPTTPTDPDTTPTTPTAPADPGTPGGTAPTTPTGPSTGVSDAHGGPAEPSVPAPAPGRRAPDRTGPKASLVVSWSSTRSSVLRLRVGADEPGRFVVRYRVGRDTKKQQRAVRLTLTRGKLLRTVNLRLRAADRRTLLRGRSLRVLLTSEARDAAGNVARRSLTIRLKPKKQKTPAPKSGPKATD
jgi:hypothetical protein